MKQKAYKKKGRIKRRRKKNFSFVVSFICFVMVLAALASAAVIFFKTGEIRVIGETKYPANQIIEASGIKKGQSMFLFNEFASQHSIFASCPYIDTIQIRRTLPDIINIIVTPCLPAVIVNSEGSFYILDIKGKILEQIPSPEGTGLSVVTGAVLKSPEIGKEAAFFEEESAKALYSLLNTAKNSDILENIGDIDLTKVYDIKFKYLERFTVEIGTAEDMERKLKFMEAVIESLSETDRGTIDVSDNRTGYFTQDRNINS